MRYRHSALPAELTSQLGAGNCVGSHNTVGAWIFFRLYFHFYLSSVHNSEDHFHIRFFKFTYTGAHYPELSSSILILWGNPVPYLFIFLEAPHTGFFEGVYIIANHDRAVVIYCLRHVQVARKYFNNGDYWQLLWASLAIVENRSGPGNSFPRSDANELHQGRVNKPLTL